MSTRTDTTTVPGKNLERMSISSRLHQVLHEVSWRCWCSWWWTMDDGWWWHGLQVLRIEVQRQVTNVSTLFHQTVSSAFPTASDVTLGVEPISWRQFVSCSRDVLNPIKHLWSQIHSPLKYLIRKGNRSSSNHWFSELLLVSGLVVVQQYSKHKQIWKSFQVQHHGYPPGN